MHFPPTEMNSESNLARAARKRHMPPRLLVSVRNREEALAAVAGGCDILDLKEPSRGSLGRADAEAITDVATWLQAEAPHIPLSAALGEARDWLAGEALTYAPATSLAFVKLGCAGLGGSDWSRDWNEARRCALAPGPDVPRWIAVAYADWRDACAPAPAEVIAAAIAENCAGVLFDTFQKDGRTLFEHLGNDELALCIAATRDAGLLVALAGGLLLRDLPRAAAFAPDVIAVRTAACRDERRSAPVASAAVRELRRALDRIPADASGG